MVTCRPSRQVTLFIRFQHHIFLMKTKLTLLALTLGSVTATHASLIDPIGRYSFAPGSGGAEIISYDSGSQRLYSTRGNGIEIIDASDFGNMSSVSSINLSNAF